MVVTINGEKVQVTFNKHTKLMKSSSTICNSKIKIGEKVLYESRGYLYYDKKWIFCGLNQINPKESKNLVLLLESPHKNEFLGTHPLRPANGVTGNKINLLLARKICKHLNNHKNTIFKVWLVNAIQYQTSCYNSLHNKSDYDKNWRTIRNNVFKTLINDPKLNLIQDLNDRIKGINPSFVINCVTSARINNRSLKEIVENGMIRKSDFDLPHPSSWK